MPEGIVSEGIVSENPKGITQPPVVKSDTASVSIGNSRVLSEIKPSGEHTKPETQGVSKEEFLQGLKRVGNSINIALYFSNKGDPEGEWKKLEKETLGKIRRGKDEQFADFKRRAELAKTGQDLRKIIEEADKFTEDTLNKLREGEAINDDEAMKIAGIGDIGYFSAAIGSFIDKGIKDVGLRIERKVGGDFRTFFSKDAIIKNKEGLKTEAERIKNELDTKKAAEKDKVLKQMAEDVYRGALAHRLAMEADVVAREEEAKNAEMGTD